jgi:hypothetical protein
MVRLATFTLALAAGSLALTSSCRKKAEPDVRRLRLPVAEPAAAPATSAAASGPPELKLRTAFEVVGDEAMQPSGLAVFGRRLLMVSDKHDNVVFELERRGTEAHVLPFVWFEPPSGEPAPLDYEAIAVDGRSLLIASESRLRVLRLELSDTLKGNPHVTRASWLTPSLREVGQAAGLFRVANAYLEGLIPLHKHQGSGLLLAAERDPRGLIHLRSRLTLEGAQAWSMPLSTHAVPPGREPDFADLTDAGLKIYALVRNGHLIVELEQSSKGWQEQRAWSYALAENDPRYVYEDTRFGLAEGLAMSEEAVFIVLDNNGQARRAAPNNRRPLLFVFERPRD